MERNYIGGGGGGVGIRSLIDWAGGVGIRS